MMYRRILASFFFFVLIAIISKAQSLVKSSEFYSIYEYVAHKQNNNITIHGDKAISGVLLKAKPSNNFEGTSLLIQSSEINFEEDFHNELSTYEIASQLITLPQETYNIQLHLATLSDTIRIILIHQSSGEKTTINNLQAMRISSEAPCAAPDAIPQNIWRNTPTELPPPTVVPTETEVHHVIIHHAAGSNTETNYTSVVRNYYVLHTQVNGWDDIGYNYLVAQDGTIFTGRDSQGYFEHDNVRGAHMCGKNNNTMAICLLGNYQSVQPPAVMMEAMKQIVAWKIHKEELDPLGNSLHGIGPTSANLPDAPLGHIAGHREGCSPGYTVCPGTFVFEQMDQIRNDVDYMINHQCEIPQSTGNKIDEQFKITIQDRILIIESTSTYDELSIYYPDGKIAYRQIAQNDKKVKIDLINWENGLYILTGSNQKGILNEKFVLY